MGFVLILTESEIALNSPIEFGLYFGCFFINGFHLLYNMEPTKKKMKPSVTQTTACCEIFVWQEMHSKIKYQIIEIFIILSKEID